MSWEPKEGARVRILQGRWKGCTGTYANGMACGKLHRVDLDRGTVTLAPLDWIQDLEPKAETSKVAPAP